MKWQGLVATLVVLVVGSVFADAQASGLNLNVSNDAGWVQYDSKIGFTPLDFSAQAMHNTNDGTVGGIGLGLRENANPGGNPVTAMLGAKALWISPSYPGVSNGYVVALGGGVNFALPAYNRLSFGGYIYWAPSVTSFSNAKRYLAMEVHAGYRLLPNGTVYVGYRRITARFKNTASVMMDNGFNVGFSIRF